MRFLKKVQVTALQGDPKSKAIDILRHYLMKEDAKKWSFVKGIEDYAASRKLDNEYMLRFAKKLSWLSGVITDKYQPEEEVEQEDA